MLKSSLVGTEKSLKSLLRLDNRRPSSAPAEPLEMAPVGSPGLSYRSVVTHAVLGSGPLELLMLPTELLHCSFSALDSAALCQLAQVSIGCRQLADDPLVWHAVCGHSKEQERARSLSLQARRREAEQRRAAERKQSNPNPNPYPHLHPSPGPSPNPSLSSPRLASLRRPPAG